MFSPNLSLLEIIQYSIAVYRDFPWCSPALHVIIHLKAPKCIGRLGPGQSAQPHLAAVCRQGESADTVKFLYDQPNWFIDEEECLQIKTISECKQIFTSAKLIRKNNWVKIPNILLNDLRSQSINTL